MTNSDDPLQRAAECRSHGRLAARAGRLEEARAAFLESLHHDPRHAGAYLWLASIAPSEREAYRYLGAAREIIPNSARLRQAAEYIHQIFRQAPGTAAGPVQAGPAITSAPILGAPPPRPGATAARRAKAPVIRAAYFWHALAGLLRYTAVKGLMLFVTVALGIYLVILIVNLGGYVDEIFAAQIQEQVGMMVRGGWPENVDEPERTELIEQRIWAMEEAKGLHRPFLERSGRWLVQALALNLAEGYSSPQALGVERDVVRDLVRERLPYTLALVGISNLTLFLASVWAALVLSRKQSGLLDRLTVLLLSLTSAPSWIHGVILILVFAGLLRILPFPRRWDQLPDRFTVDFALLLLRHMVLPLAAIVVSSLFQGIYAWRSFFLIFRHEDYVDMARAKGLRPQAIERSYIVRPTLPYVLTNFATMMIVFWQGSIALEMVFYWPGIGPLFMQAARRFDTPLLLGVVIIFAYLLALTVFLLDIIYALVDPRVTVRVPGGDARSTGARPRRWPNLQPRRWLAGAAPWLSAAGARLASLPVRLAGLVRAYTAHRTTTAPRHKHPTPPTRVAPVSLAQLRSTLRQLARYPSAVLGTIVIVGLVAWSVYVVIALPRDQVVELWRGQGGDADRALWYRNPKSAPPAWTNLFRSTKLPTTIALSTRPGEAGFLDHELPWITGLDASTWADTGKVLTPFSDGAGKVALLLPFDYPYRTFPQDVAIYLDVQYVTKQPHVRMAWIKPDGEEIDLGSPAISSRTDVLYLSQDSRLQRRYGERTVIQYLFADLLSLPQAAAAQSGTYRLQIEGTVFEQESAIDAELVVLGQLAGLAGTDANRRDLMVALAWGTPVALAFGLLGTLGTSLLSMTLAATGVWFGGWVDELIQRATDLNMTLPTLPIVILVYFLYSKSIWAILGVVVVLAIFGGAIKNYRSAFLQLKAAPYIEAGQAYGASGWRIISRYLIPRILPMMVPQMMVIVPGYVFLEATLAYLGVFDPALPTWGKVINDALASGDVATRAYWVLEPVALLVLAGLAFGGLGFALERILNPRLRET